MGRVVANSYMRFMNKYKREHPEIEVLNEDQQGDVIGTAYRNSRKRSPQRRRSPNSKSKRSSRPRSFSPRRRSSRN